MSVAARSHLWDEEFPNAGCGGNELNDATLRMASFRDWTVFVLSFVKPQ
jgi:hypothetical protein